MAITCSRASATENSRRFTRAWDTSSSLLNSSRSSSAVLIVASSFWLASAIQNGSFRNLVGVSTMEYYVFTSSEMGHSTPKWAFLTHRPRLLIDMRVWLVALAFTARSSQADVATTPASASPASSQAVAFWAGIDQTQDAPSLREALRGRIRSKMYCRTAASNCYNPKCGGAYVTYGGARQALGAIDSDPEYPGNITSIYSRKLLPGVWDSGRTWNREHVFPQSYMSQPNDEAGADYSDLHALFPEIPSVNSARGNSYFGRCLPSQAGVHGVCSSPAHPLAAPDTAKSALMFLPPAAVRGDIARAVFYMALRYGSRDSRANVCTCARRRTAGHESPTHARPPARTHARPHARTQTCTQARTQARTYTHADTHAGTTATSLARTRSACQTARSTRPPPL
jgi:hypothetical protein